MKNWNLVVAVSLGLLVAGVAQAQRDSVYTRGAGDANRLVRGKVVATTAFKVTVETESGKKDVPSSEVKKIAFSGEPRGLTRARDHLESERFDDCLSAIKKLKLPDSKFVRQEAKFLEAFASGKKSLLGDQAISTAAAEQLLGKFVRENSDSYRLVRAVDLYAQLLLANGKTKEAQKEFNKLTKSRWPEFESRGRYFEGEALIHQGDFAAAKSSFQKLANASGTDKFAKEYRLLSQCQLAKLTGLEGGVDSAVATLEKIIKDENSDNARLFALAYNSLGTCYMQKNELKKACRAFLHTELLFSTETNAHAEALYNLAKIWPQLNETERANRARSTLTSRYRNTIWASKL